MFPGALVPGTKRVGDRWHWHHQELVRNAKLRSTPDMLNQIIVFTRSPGDLHAGVDWVALVYSIPPLKNRRAGSSEDYTVELLGGLAAPSPTVPRVALANLTWPFWGSASFSINWGSGWRGCCDEFLAESFFQSKSCRNCLCDESWVTCTSHFWFAQRMLLIKTWITNFTPVYFPFQGRSCMHCIIRWIRQPKSHFPSEKKLWESGGYELHEESWLRFPKQKYYR